MKALMCGFLLYVESAKHGVKELKSYSYISLSFDFVNKPLSLTSPLIISPLLECPKLNKPPGGSIELLWNFTTVMVFNTIGTRQKFLVYFVVIESRKRYSKSFTLTPSNRINGSFDQCIFGLFQGI